MAEWVLRGVKGVTLALRAEYRTDRDLVQAYRDEGNVNLNNADRVSEKLRCEDRITTLW